MNECRLHLLFSVVVGSMIFVDALLDSSLEDSDDDDSESLSLDFIGETLKESRTFIITLDH